MIRKPGSRNQARIRIKRERERAKMPKETTHRDPEKRAARIERRSKKRTETVNRKRLMKTAKANRTPI